MWNIVHRRMRLLQVLVAYWLDSRIVDEPPTFVWHSHGLVAINRHIRHIMHGTYKTNLMVWLFSRPLMVDEFKLALSDNWVKPTTYLNCNSYKRSPDRYIRHY